MTRDYKFFKTLNDEEEKEYRQWAKDNYIIGDSISSAWHPVVVDECMTILTKDMKDGVDSKE
tara:strand:+ start:258 stop:443 length:186 start_codon:yes stop_codon:yes gene_type:complete